MRQFQWLYQQRAICKDQRAVNKHIVSTSIDDSQEHVFQSVAATLSWHSSNVSPSLRRFHSARSSQSALVDIPARQPLCGQGRLAALVVDGEPRQRPQDVRICWGGGGKCKILLSLDLWSPRTAGGEDYALIINISQFECTMSKEIYLKYTYFYVSYLSYLIILHSQYSHQNQCMAKTRSRYLERPNI
jgi:hypothetical protein